ncbi:C2 domain [Dillenia turbinata]|uniref:C2 domain n=1 Tax=Dillenia turbinata TaxID=194707 RepID=A0AAN8WD05_9MAGN
MACGTLQVMLVNAKDLKESAFLGKSNAYIVIHYGTQQHQTSVVRGEGRNPEWNEKFSFRTEYPASDDHDYKLVFRIMDKHHLGKDKFVGETTIYVKDILSMGAETSKVELHHQKYRIELEDKSFAGEICVSLNFTLDLIPLPGGAEKFDSDESQSVSRRTWKRSGKT